jgi:hypothetical protein
MSDELRTYGDDAIVRDVQKEIEILTATENLLLNGLRKSSARNMVHSWQDDTLDTAASGAQNEYVAFTPGALSTPTLRTNIVEHVYKAGSVTNAQTMVTHESGENEYSRQVAKVLKNWANAAEYDLLRSSLTSGVSGTAPTMNGIINTISTNATTHTSGTTFSETILLGLMQLTWDNSNGDVVTDVIVGANLKKKISGFTAGITKNIGVSEKKAGAVVGVYESDFGTVNVHLHRYLNVSGTDATARCLGLNMEKYYVANLNGEGAKMTEQAVRATSKDFVVDGYLTLENRNEACSFYSDGFNLTA